MKMKEQLINDSDDYMKVESECKTYSLSNNKITNNNKSGNVKSWQPTIRDKGRLAKKHSVTAETFSGCH
jgi:hypothetical protein